MLNKFITNWMINNIIDSLNIYYKINYVSWSGTIQRFPNKQNKK